MIHQQQSNPLSTPVSLSDSTLIFKETKRSSSMKTRVSFNRSVLVYEDDAYSQEDRNRMHYTRAEFSSFAGAILQYVESGRRIERQTSQSYSSPLLATGLEGFLNTEHKMKHRLQGVLAVMMEQERQYREEGLFTPVDFDSMYHVYHMASQESQEEAYQRALTQQKMVKEADFYSKSNDYFPMASQERQDEAQQVGLIQHRVVSRAA